VVAYESRKLTPAEANYAPHERELLSVIHALTKWQHYLKGRHFTVQTDNDPTTHIMTQKTLSPRQVRWIGKLALFDFDIIHKAGRTNHVPDMLSRRLDYQFNAMTTATNTKMLTTLDADAAQDPRYLADKQKLHEQKTPWLEEINGRLYFKEDPPRLYIPASRLRAQLLHEAHDCPISGHLGRDKTLERLARNYYWPIQEYVRSCDECQRNKAANRAKPGLLQPLEVPMRNWDHVLMDFIGPLPISNDYDCILTFTDKLSKMIHLAPTSITVSAPDAAYLFFDHVFKHHGLPRVLISDRDSRFQSDFWQQLFKLTGTDVRLSTSYHPQTDGQTERDNRTIEDMLRPFVNAHLNNWHQLLPAVEFAYNNSVHASTGHTPFFLNYGQHPRTPDIFALAPTEPPKNHAVDEFTTRMRNALRSATEHLQRAVAKQKESADKHRRHDEFNIGDKVLLSTENLHIRLPEQTSKLLARRCGPFTITNKLSPLLYRLKLPDNWQVRCDVFHIDTLTRYHESPNFPERAKRIRPVPLHVDGDTYYLVEAILDRRWDNRKRQMQYLVKWLGYDNSHNSWEWTSALEEQQDVAQMIREYNIARTGHASDDDIVCEICHSTSTSPPVIICDKCDKGYHITCLAPPLPRVPRGRWLCPTCSHPATRSKRKR